MAYRGLTRGAAAAAARRDSGRQDHEREARGEDSDRGESERERELRVPDVNIMNL